MRKTFLGVLVFMSQLIFAQGIEVISTKALTLDGQGVFLPKISPKGDCVLVTNEDMSGLKKFDLATGKLTTITNDRSAGFNAQFSEDGSTVIYRKSEYKGKLRYSSLNSVNLQTGKTEQLVKPTRNLEGVTVKGGTVLAVNNSLVLPDELHFRIYPQESALQHVWDSPQTVPDTWYYRRRNGPTPAVLSQTIWQIPVHFRLHAFLFHRRLLML